jgi:hypothetical protein
LARKPAQEAEDDVSQTQDPSVDEATSQNDSASADEQAQPEPPDTNQPTEDELDAVDQLEGNLAKNDEGRITETERKFIRLAAAYPTTTPGEQVIGGYGGVNVTVGDIRRLGIALRDKYRGQVE